MSIASSPADVDVVLRMVVGRPTPDWLVLHLPDGRYAAFWAQGLGIEHASGVAAGNYSGCAYIGATKADVLGYIHAEDNFP